MSLFEDIDEFELMYPSAPKKDEIKNTNNLFKLLRQRAINTPDFQELREEKEHIVFVYGSLKRGFGNNALLEGAKYLGEAYTAVSNLCMSSAGGFPVIFDRGSKNNDFSKRGHVTGEAYAVSLHILAGLDRLENNGVMYTREKKFVFLRDQEVPKIKTKNFIPSVSAWIYIGNEDYWEGRFLPTIEPEQKGESLIQSARKLKSYLTWNKSEHHF